MQGEMAKPRLTCGNRSGSATHVSEHQAGEQRKAPKRDGKEWNDAADDLGAGPFGSPCELRDRIALLVDEIENVVAGQRRLIDPLQIAQLQTRSDLRQYGFVDKFHAQHDGR